MIEPEELAQAFARNVSIIGRQADGLTQADSLLQPPFRGNCLNWVLGHLANNRDSILQLLGQQPILGEAAARYRRESEPVTGDGEGVLSLAELLSALERSQPVLERALRLVSPEELAKEVPFAGRTVPVGQRLFFMYFHETYHTGQTELLRQLAGKGDKVI
jgi:uncharacterized damage-inducible protein DinB